MSDHSVRLTGLREIELKLGRGTRHGTSVLPRKVVGLDPILSTTRPTLTQWREDPSYRNPVQSVQDRVWVGRG